MTISKARFAALILACALLFAGIGAGVALAAQGHMLTAKTDLQSALSELNAASADKGGHRANAIKLVNQAITEVEAGIQAGAQ
ncbi:MAG TPA: hypothetical protein VGI19_06565 [Candidatus Cybelea sp.]|jgi:hypothetical protein